MSDPLANIRHETWCREVITGKSDVEAYRIAFNCSQKTAESNATRLRDNAGVCARLAELRQPILDRYDITADNITREMALIGFHRAKDYAKFLSSGNLDDVTSEQSAAIKDVRTKVDEAGKSIVEVKFADKMAPLNSLARIIGLTTDTNVNMPVTFTVEFAQPKLAQAKEVK